jgi:hypothetical protein
MTRHGAGAGAGSRGRREPARIHTPGKLRESRERRAERALIQWLYLAVHGCKTYLNLNLTNVWNPEISPWR